MCVEADFVPPVDEDLAVLLCVLCEVVVVVAGFLAVESAVEVWPALAAVTHASIASVPTATSLALRICVQLLKPKTFTSK